MRARPESSDPWWDTYPDTILEVHSSPPRLRDLGLGRTWGTVTAYNPGRLVEPAVNEKRQTELAAAVTALGAPLVGSAPIRLG